MTERERARFDSLLERVIDRLPEGVRRMLEEIPVIVLDLPTAEMLKSLGMDPGDPEAALELCGLHTGTANTEQSVEHSGELPPDIHLFREGIIDLAGGWESDDADEAISEEIRITLLHEIGHQFGLDEEDLENLGYE